MNVKKSLREKSTWWNNTNFKKKWGWEPLFSVGTAFSVCMWGSCWVKVCDTDVQQWHLPCSTCLSGPSIITNTTAVHSLIYSGNWYSNSRYLRGTQIYPHSAQQSAAAIPVGPLRWCWSRQRVLWQRDDRREVTLDQISNLVQRLMFTLG